uniref:Arrestin-like N-terminal domain-containing protein n=1 Tax=Romanomermis culicivorax TaxID=13658 RepID=A0A915K1F1_ROMCU
MGKAVKKFDIVFSNPNGAFYAGQPVTGTVIVEVEETIKIRGVKLKFIGEAYVNFSDGKLKKSHTESIKYFEQVDLIFGSSKANIIGFWLW